VVQAVDDIYENNNTTTYRRTFIRNIAPMYLRLANWPFSHVDVNKNDGIPTNQDMPMLCLKWFLTSIVIIIVVRVSIPYPLNCNTHSDPPTDLQPQLGPNRLPQRR
jgi:hypothetical protein